MEWCQILHRNMAAHAFFGGQGFFIRPPGSGEHTAHGDKTTDILLIAEDREVCRKMLHGDELHQLVFLSLLVFLGEGMHVRSTYSSHRCPAVIDDISLEIIFLSQRFSQKLGIPPAEGAEFIAVGHNHFCSNTVFFHGDELQSRQEKSGILLPIL